MIYEVPEADMLAIQAAAPAEVHFEVIERNGRYYTEDAYGWRMAHFFDLDAAVAAATTSASWDEWLAGSGTPFGMVIGGTWIPLPPAKPPVTTALQGNERSYLTDPNASRVTVQVLSPSGGPSRARPTIDGVPVAGGGGPFVYDRAGHVFTIETRAGNNDVVILEEF